MIPVLAAVVTMLLFDRILAQDFFMPQEGGTYSFLSIFFFWHSKVYIMLAPLGLFQKLFQYFQEKKFLGIPLSYMPLTPLPCYLFLFGRI